LTNTPAQVCPLCFSQQVSLWHTETRRPLAGREYWRCSSCDLVYVPTSFHLSPEQEKTIYQQHDNRPDDPGYRHFLGRVLEPLLPFLEAIKKREGRVPEGLDFGSGPGPTLSLMFREAGYDCVDYDPYFALHPELLERQYDFLVSTEVFEHLAQPAQVMDQLLACLKPGGYLGIMTQRPRDLEAFRRWHYLMDPTHITFYSEASFDWLAAYWKLQKIHVGQATIILGK